MKGGDKSGQWREGGDKSGHWREETSRVKGGRRQDRVNEGRRQVGVRSMKGGDK